MTRQGDARVRLASIQQRVEMRAERLAALVARFDRLAKRHEQGTAPVAVSSFNLFPTPAEVARKMAAAADFQVGHRVLEPSAGTGRLLDVIPQGVDVVAVEESQALCANLFHSYPGVLLKRGDYLERTTLDLGGLFDRIIMNPPFERGTDVRHIMHARSMLAPGGLLVALCYDGVAQNRHLKPIATTWEVLPAGSFRSEGTSAGVVMFTMRGE
jgi:phospholipid N-methyltransferase